LIRARRWDGAATDPSVELRYAYDGADHRVRKTAVSAAEERHSIYVFDSLELRRAAFVNGDYERTMKTEVVYLFAGGVRLARLHHMADDAPRLQSGSLHVFLELPDYLGSSSIVIDRDSGELVERATYQAYGAAESDFRPTRWDSFREDYRFTGKEEDVEVGLQYFDRRYYAPNLGRFVSADPLAVGAVGQADLNVYAYVHGRVMVDTDPDGLTPRKKGKGKGGSKKKAAGKGGKPPSKKLPPEAAVIGNAEHAIIGNMYQARNPLNKVYLDRTIAEIVSDYGLHLPRGFDVYANWRPDIGDAGKSLRKGSVGIETNTIELVEIKPAGSEALALEEVQGYQWILNQSGMHATLKDSNAPGMKGSIKLALFEARWWSPADGVIVYTASLKIPFPQMWRQPVAHQVDNRQLNRGAQPEQKGPADQPFVPPIVILPTPNPVPVAPSVPAPAPAPPPPAPVPRPVPRPSFWQRAGGLLRVPIIIILPKGMLPGSQPPEPA
jgi:RHS repeat-associated protein